ncbi:DUF6778 family protein [Aliiroseovarius sp.]|uniref:DUF6778 family protein n=1 Tax=Aliiroseovarius sp. TaxID=1872442 RepID=UPI00263734DA|nr:DUF6778 family protein [Aliiroseovarius sp.]
MIPKRLIFAMIATFGLTACAATDVVTRNSTDVGPLLSSAAEDTLRPDISVAQLNVTVPETLKVSEANRFYPGGDIVWRGEPYGNRYEQVRAIFETGMGNGIARLSGPQAVVVDIEVERFHSVTERTRYTVGGVHSIRFLMTVRDAETGVVLEPARSVAADLKAYGGQAAMRAEAMGRGQKVRLVEHLEKVILAELTRPRDAGAPILLAAAR